ncbi:hypothetical protein [Pedobacter cryoconitis]|uniref:Lipoprotein n=1 Tax=Pedobacter cryoconitis TaxID=188932 RepID=A0A7X0J8C4_9SPHI|nr:hypothetical protein [Pedobacter cryoconitis]MBB6501551.1 hypothetical protein [Pedobacter cryoconitis]
MKLKLSVLFTALIAIGAVACKQKEAADTQSTGTRRNASIPDSVLVDVKTAKHYVKNYAPHAGYVDQTEEDVRARRPKKPDTRCVWFSKQRLQEMLNQLDEENGDGVRFYMITYDNKYDTTEVAKTPYPEKKYWGYNTLLMVSTREVKDNGNTLHYDYYTNDFVKHSDARQKRPGFIITFVPENRGELCPPPANCAEVGATLLDN